MNKHDADASNELSDAALSRTVRAAAAALVVVALLFVATGSSDDLDVIPVVNASTAQGGSDGYFPARFPTPQGDPEPHVEAF